jgi:hypothetical protein
MLAAEPLPDVEVSSHGRRHRRHRSRRSRFMRNLRRSWRSTRWRKLVLSVVLVCLAVVGGYKVTMYVVNQEVNLQEFQQH